jgi:hypothetical protein
LTCSFAGGRIIPSRPLLIPKSRWSAIVAASTSSPSPTCCTVASTRAHDLAGRFKAALDVQRPVAPIADPRRCEAHLWVLGDAEEVGRAQVLVAQRVSGVEAVGVDPQLDRRPVRPGLV